MTRISTWEAALSDYIASVRDQPHNYGAHDCGLFFGGGVLAITGNDHAAPFRGKYRTATGAAKVLRKHGAGTLEATIDALFPVIEPAFAQRGDGIWNGVAVGICMGSYALFVGQEGEKEGLVRIERSAWRKAWRVE